MSVGDTGALDYAVNSAATFREALEVTTRYTRLINDALDLRFEVAGTRALVDLDTKAFCRRAAEDFMMASFYRNRICRYLRAPAQHRGQPRAQRAGRQERIRTHVRAGHATLRHAVQRLCARCPCARRAVADRRPKATHRDPQTRRRILSEMPASRNLTEKVRHLVTNESRRQPTAAHIARKLHMSGRTLARRLEGEGTTFTEVLHDLRRRLAQQYVGSRDIALSEVAFLLGFSHTAAFHRAFKRWTKQTPLEYRRAHSR